MPPIATKLMKRSERRRGPAGDAAFPRSDHAGMLANLASRRQA